MTEKCFKILHRKTIRAFQMYLVCYRTKMETYGLPVTVEEFVYITENHLLITQFKMGYVTTQSKDFWKTEMVIFGLEQDVEAYVFMMENHLLT